jgi:glycosyltransferase involved in cell wall biosynthesis
MKPELTLDVITPTFERADLLRLTLDSLLRAEMPEGLKVSCVVVDNNSRDNTKEVVREYVEKYADTRPGFFRYLFESEQGVSSARNRGIRMTKSDWIAFIDDDEEVCATWFVRAFAEMQKPEVAYFGGPYLLKPGLQIPAWAAKHKECRGPIGGFEHSHDQDFEFTKDCKMQTLGGNVVIKRSILERIGLYDTALGRTDKGLLSSEDEDMHERLVASGARGFYLKDLVIFHHVPKTRLTKAYHRKWFFGIGVSQGVRSQKKPQSCVYVGRIPRWVLGQALRTLPKALYDFGAELKLRHCLGFIYGSYRRASRAT